MLSIGVKTQPQALVRTRKSLLIKEEPPATMTHDEKRDSAATLVAALNTLDKKVIGRRADDRRNREFIAFLDRVEKEMPDKLSIHAVLDNHAVHKHRAVKDWLAEHPRWIFHFTPNSCFFEKLDRRPLRGGVRHSIEQDGKSILEFNELQNGKAAEAYKWTADSERLIAAEKETPSE